LARRRSTFLIAFAAVVALTTAPVCIADLVKPASPRPASLPLAHRICPAESAADTASLHSLALADIEAVRQVRLEQLATAELIDICSRGLAGCPSDLLAPTVAHAPSAGSAYEILELPAPPGGGTLTLTGLLTLAGVQFSRSARRLQFSVLPEWYHAACPDQIGHRLAFDFNDHAPIATLPAIAFAVPPATPRSTIPRGPQDATVPQLRPQCVLILAAPRGPPCTTPAPI
jgi:hypothetical protein